MFDINIIDNYIDFVSSIKRPITRKIMNQVVPFFNYKYNIHNNNIQRMINISINLILIYF